MVLVWPSFFLFFSPCACTDHLSASAGISLGAASEKFFLEQYLDAPVEQELAQLCGVKA